MATTVLLPLANASSAKPAVAANDLSIGLTVKEASRRLGIRPRTPCRTPARTRFGWHSVNPGRRVPWMLEVAVLLQLGLGEYVEASVIGLLLVLTRALGFFQEARAQERSEPKGRFGTDGVAQRDGTWRMVPATDLVVGDVVKLSLGAVPLRTFG